MDMKIKITFTEQLLGTKPANESVFTEYIAAKKLDGTPDDEIDAAKRLEAEVEGLEKSMTCFQRNCDGIPMLWNYQIKGFFKDACGGLRRCSGTKSSAMKAYKTVIDSCIFVMEREIPLTLPEGGKVGICERPLRAETMQGPRVALAKSETVPKGTSFECTIRLLNDSLKDTVKEWLDYGALRGLGQWRNSGMGAFTWEEIK